MGSSPHVLFLLGDTSLARGGINSIYHGITQLIQYTVREYNKQIENQVHLKISCITTSPTGSVGSLDGVDIIYPEVCNQPCSLSQLVYGDEELFSDKHLEEKLSDVTSVILFAYNSPVPEDTGSGETFAEVHEGTLLCVLLEKLVGRVKRYSKCVTKVTLINLLNLSRIPFENGLFDEVGFVFNVGSKVHSMNNKFVEGKGKASNILYPLFPTLATLEQPYSDSLGHFVVITYVSKKTIDDCHFLSKCQECIKMLKREFEERGQTKRIEWEVYFTNGCKMDIPEADVQKNFSGEKLDRLQAASLCIVHGDFESDVYSGLELLLSGIPTLIMKGTDTYHVLNDLAAAVAAYFGLSSASDAKWEESVREKLEHLKKAETEAKKFAQEYRKHILVRNSLEKLLEDSCDVRVKLEEIPNVLDSDSLPAQPLPSSSSTLVYQRLDPKNDLAKIGTYTEGANESEETVPKHPSNNTKTPECESVQTDGGYTLHLESILLKVLGAEQSSNSFIDIGGLPLHSGHVECDGPEELSSFHAASLQPQGGARRKTKVSPLPVRKEMNSQGDSDEKSGDDEEPCTSRVSSATASTGRKSSSSKASHSLFTTRKYPKSDFERKMRKIKKEAEKPVKSKKKDKEKK